MGSIHRRGATFWLPGLAAALILAACEALEEAAPPVPTTLAVLTRDTMLFDGATLQLQAEVRDRNGQPITNAAVSWTSRDSSTASVSSAGLLTARAAGETWVVATADQLADSVFIGVRFRVAAGEARVRVQGAVEATWGWGGVGFFEDRLGTIQGDLSLVMLARGLQGLEEEMEPDTFFMFTLPAGPAAGTTIFQSWDPTTLGDRGPEELGIALAALVLGPMEGRFTAYANTGNSRVELETVAAPPGPGFVAGSVAGRIVFEGAGYDVQVLEDAPDVITPNGKSIKLYGDFSVGYYHFPVANVAAEVRGGPYAGTVADAEAWGILVGSGLGVHVNGVLGSLEPEIWVWWPARGTGTFPLRDLPQSEDPSGWVEAFAVLWYHDAAELLGGSTSGTVSVDGYTAPPSDSVMGEVRGNVEATLQVSSESGPTGQEATLTMSFHAPVLPPAFGGGPAVAGAPARVRRLPAAPPAVWRPLPAPGALRRQVRMPALRRP